MRRFCTDDSISGRRKQRPPPLASPIIASALHKHTALAVHLSAHKTFAVEKTVKFNNTELTNFIEFTLSGLASFVYSLPLARRIGRSRSMELCHSLLLSTASRNIECQPSSVSCVAPRHGYLNCCTVSSSNEKDREEVMQACSGLFYQNTKATTVFKR